MFKKIESASPDIVALEAQGYLTKEDYLTSIVPVLDKARKEGRKLRFLIQFGPKFEGFTPAAAWEDFKLGIHHMGTFERLAVVSDKSWILTVSKIFGSLMPCTVKVFNNTDAGDALSWLDSGDIGLDFDLDEHKGTLTVEIKGPLTSDNFVLMSHTVDKWLEKNNKLNGLIIHGKKFPGWEDLGSFISHITFVHDHHRLIKKVALVIDGELPALVSKLAVHFMEAQIKQFPFDQIQAAKNWAGQSDIDLEVNA